MLLIAAFYNYFFFFSSRRRHTRFKCDWSSDVCSSDLLANHNRLSFGIVMSSGDLFNMGSNRVLNGDSTESSTFQRPLFVGPDTIRAAWVAEINARYSRLFPVTEKKSVEVLAETTNHRNRLNVTALTTTATVDAAGNSPT